MDIPVRKQFHCPYCNNEKEHDYLNIMDKDEVKVKCTLCKKEYFVFLSEWIEYDYLNN